MTLSEKTETAQLRKDFVTGRVLFYLSMGALFVAGALLLLYFYWNNNPYRPLILYNKNHVETNTIEVANSNKLVENGGIINLRFTGCKTLEARGVVTATLIGKTVKTPLVWPEEKSSVGCFENVVAAYGLPKLLNKEAKYIDFVVEYHVNPIRIVTVEFRTEEFGIRD